MTPEERESKEMRVKEVWGIAVRLAPSFRDKFDFSSDEHFSSWADIAYKAGEALLVKREKMIKEAGKEPTNG